MTFRTCALLCAMLLALTLTGAGRSRAEDAEPLTYIEGDTLYVCEGVTVMGSEILRFEEIPGTGEYREIEAPVDEADVYCCLDWGMGDRDWLEGQRVRRIVLPESLRVLGDEAMYCIQADELVLSSGIRYVGSDAFYAVTFGRLVIPAGYDCDIPDGEYSDIGAYVVEEGNPRYKSIDGVLFSADGKTLLRYPNRRQATHYDVPRGVTEIADRAFQDDMNAIPLKTVSLPIGLTRIGAYAFSDCGRLQSLTVPLTVTDLAPDAFAFCVSLERLSLPPGLSAELNTHAVDPVDFTHYMGDNGGTGESGDPDSPDDVWYPARLVPSDGVSRVPYYATATAATPAGWEQAGTVVQVEYVAHGRCGDEQYDWETNFRGVKWFDADALRSHPSRPFFRVTDGAPLSPTVVTPEGDVLPADHLVFDGVDEDEGTVDFYYPDDRAEDEINFLNLPIRSCRLYRAEDGRRMGLILPDGDQPVAWLYDAPEGAAAVPCYTGDQALVSEEESGWLHVRTLYAEGWLKQADFYEVGTGGEQTREEGGAF